MSKKQEWKIVVGVSILLIAAISVWWQFRMYQGRQSLQRSMNTRASKATVARDGYAIYRTQLNKKLGTKDVTYFPCPRGYVCEKLPPPRFIADSVVFDRCQGQVCLENLRMVLYLYGVEELNAYLADKKEQ